MTWNVLAENQTPPECVQMVIRDTQGNHWIAMRIGPDAYYGNAGVMLTHLTDKTVERYCVL